MTISIGEKENHKIFLAATGETVCDEKRIQKLKKRKE